MKPTKNFYELFDPDYFIFGLCGATWSGKTYPAAQFIVALYGSEDFAKKQEKELSTARALQET